MAVKQGNIKKFLIQLEGLDMAEKIISDILTEGISSLCFEKKETFQNYAQIMSNHYLPRFKSIFERIATNLYWRTYTPELSEKLLHDALNDFIVIESAINKLRPILKNKIDNSDGTVDSELKDLIEDKQLKLNSKAIYKANACIYPLSFTMTYDMYKEVWFQWYHWIDMESGCIYHTSCKSRKDPNNVVPKESLFEKHHVSRLYYVPDAYDCLIDWDEKTTESMTPADYHKIISFAADDIMSAVNRMKANIIKTQAEKCYPVLIPVARFGIAGTSMGIEDHLHHRIVLRQQNSVTSTNLSICHLCDVPYEYGEHQAMFGMMFYDPTDFTVCFHPYTLITENKIFRLID